MKHIDNISSEHVSRYFPPLEDNIIGGYIRAIEIFSQFILNTVEEEGRIILNDMTDKLYQEVRQIALSSYCFDIWGERKSKFESDGGGAGSVSTSMAYPFTKTLRVCGMI